MGKKYDLTHKHFFNLFVLKEAPKDKWKYGMRSWLCECSCGNETIVPTAFLINGHTKSCGKGCGMKKWRI